MHLPLSLVAGGKVLPAADTAGYTQGVSAVNALGTPVLLEILFG